MTPLTRALIAAIGTFALGSVLNLLAVRRGWVPRFLWFAAIVSPLSVGMLTYWGAR